MSFMTLIKSCTQVADLALRCRDLQPELDRAVNICVESLRSGGKILACGNGGSAAQASHFVAELVGRFKGQWKYLPAISLNADTAVLTALANDAGYRFVFELQILALGRPGDVLLMLSTSGQSENINLAMSGAHAVELEMIFMTGDVDLHLDGLLRVHFHVPSTDTQRIQEMHLVILHALAEGIQERLRE